MALRNAGHIGRVGDWAEMAAEAGLVSIHFVNASGSVLVAPFGGVERRFSTAPYCVGVPRPGQDPLVLDFATSIVAEGKVLVASQGGKKLPDDALIGPDGKPSADPHLLYGDYTPTGPRDHGKGTGAIRAFGDHKGSGLAFMCEMLGGSLTGNGATDPSAATLRQRHAVVLRRPQGVRPGGLLPRRTSPVRRLREERAAGDGRRRGPGAGRARGAHAPPAAGRGHAAARRHLGRHRPNGPLRRPRRAAHPAGDVVASARRRSARRAGNGTCRRIVRRAAGRCTRCAAGAAAPRARGGSATMPVCRLRAGQRSHVPEPQPRTS